MNNQKQSDLKLRVITATVIILVISFVLYLGIRLESPLPLLTLGIAILLAASRELSQATFTPHSILTEAISDGPSEADRSNSKHISAALAINEQQEDQPSVSYLGLLRSALLLILMCIPLAVFFTQLLPSCSNLNLVDRLSTSMISSLILILFLACIAGRRRLSFGARTLMSGIVGVTLLGLGGAQILVLAAQPWMLVKLIIAVAINDSLAYFVGRALGGMRLAPAISPKKTFVGSIAGLISGSLIGVAMDRWDWSRIWIWIVLILSAQMADLAKSLIKREFMIKDFASTLPGHGGVFDRIDGVLGASLGLLLIGAL